MKHGTEKQRSGTSGRDSALAGTGNVMPSEKINILVVDDLPEKILVIDSILEEMGENIVTAHSGEEALRKVLEHDFAVILLDVNMPGMDGLETASYIRKRKRSAHTPIIFITAFADEAHTSQGYSLGAVDYIFAPIVPEVLRTKVRVFVELFRMTQQARHQADERVMLAREQAARAAAEEATRRSAFLAEASTVLSRSLDFEATLCNLSRLVVPFLADFAAVTRVDEHEMPTRSELAWSDDAGEIHTRTSMGSPVVCPAIDQAIRRTLARGRTEVLTDLGCLELPQDTGKERFESSAARKAEVRSALVLPMLARGRTLGTLTVACGISGRRYGTADQALAEDLAGRAAIALDNARLYQNIQEGDRRKNDFLAMLAHELRNPLAPIRNAVHVLRLLSPTDAPLQQARDMIDRQVTHMARLIDDLLDMSRLSRGKILLRKERVDLADLVRTAVEDYRSILESNQLTLELNIADGCFTVEGDPTRLAQVVGNVLHNATKFTDAGGRVRVALQPDRSEAMAAICVRDSGIGMESAMLSQVFETFSQADRSLDRSRGGLGLGLALVKGLVELHGGQVRALSEGLGKGTEINICLPLLEGARAPSLSRRSQGAEAPAPCKVLVIEDNQDAAESLKTLFVLTGHSVEVAFSGPQAIEAARSFLPEVVLCDIGLPGGMDGYAVARMFRQDPLLNSAYLIALTGYGREEDKSLSRDAGFNAHFTKPVDFTELQRHLGEIARVHCSAGSV